MNNKKQFIIGIIILILVVSFGLLKTNIEQKERREYGVETIAKIIRFKGSAKSKYLDFKFYHNNKNYFGDWYRGGYPDVKIGEYYKIIYSSKNPKNVEIFLDERVTDSILIKKAGFNIE